MQVTCCAAVITSGKSVDATMSFAPAVLMDGIQVNELLLHCSL